MPNKPKTPSHTVRIADDIWFAALRKATHAGETVSHVVRQKLADYIHEDAA